MACCYVVILGCGYLQLPLGAPRSPCIVHLFLPLSVEAESGITGVS